MATLAAAVRRGSMLGARRVLATSGAYRRQVCTAAIATGGAAATATGAAAASSGGILGFARSQPYKFNIVMATVKTAACDYLVQRYIERREEISWKRNAVFALFGCCYLGGLQWFLYVDVFKKLWPGMASFANQTLAQKMANPAGIRALFGQVAFDNFIHYPFIYFRACHSTHTLPLIRPLSL